MCLYNYHLDGTITEYCNKCFDVRNNMDTSIDIIKAKWMTFVFCNSEQS